MNELEKSRIEKAIHNIFKEAGHNVRSISDDGTITVDIQITYHVVSIKHYNC